MCSFLKPKLPNLKQKVSDIKQQALSNFKQKQSSNFKITFKMSTRVTKNPQCASSLELSSNFGMVRRMMTNLQINHCF